MFRREEESSGSFWISYADLMAGLLFVFILLIGAIVSKSVILKSDLQQKKARLEKVTQNLQEKQKRLEALRHNLTSSEHKLESKEETIRRQAHTIALKEAEIKKLKKMLLELNTRADALNDKVVIVQRLLKETNASLQGAHKALERYKGKVLVLSNAVKEANATIAQKEEKILALLNALDEKKTRYDALIAKLRKQKAQIKALTGIRLKVIAALKEALGKKIDIDKKSGSLKLASNVLFDKGEATLKEAAKATLRKVFEEYIVTLMEDPRIRPYLKRIVIEGHTDSDGGYLYNLRLSQQRALAVMNYLLTLPVAKKYDLKPLMSASGRSYVDRIMRNGKEDKEASRRIEIKFMLKNDDAMQEIEKVLDAP